MAEKKRQDGDDSGKGFASSASPTRPDPAMPLVDELTGSLTPWDACRKLAHLPGLLFLDSAMTDPSLGRYSFLMADPFAWLEVRGPGMRWRGPGALDVMEIMGDPFEVVAALLARWPAATVSGLPPFQGGAAGLFGYDLCHRLERLPRPRHDEFQVPDLALGFYDWVVAFDQGRDTAWLVSSGRPETGIARERRAIRRRDEILELLSASGSAALPAVTGAGERATPAIDHPWPTLPGVSSNFTPEGYRDAVRRVIEYIHAGDCYQVNLSQRLLHAATLPPLELYARLRERNAAPFAGYFDMGEFAIATASPERFVRVVEGEVETRPIKGTRPRGLTPEEDRRNADELLASAKDRAENVMIVDLLRNDLGRVCRFDSVRVPGMLRLESYRYVHHLVSEVRGTLAPGRGPLDLLRASFPGGSVTGAPKVRAMEIIAELEPTVRGPYCGSLGYVGFDGTMDTNILIRTFTAGKGWYQFPVGGGVVADSDAASELEETLHKAEGLLQALRT